MNITGNKKIAGIVGNPVAHSLSPRIHNFLFKRHNIDAVYQAFAIENEEKLEEFVKTFRSSEFLGGNVTIPYKSAVLPFVDEVILDSHIIGAANTLYWENGKICATTTDFFGLSMALTKDKFFIDKGKRVVILGNGGLARTIAMSLATNPPLPFSSSPQTLALVGRNSQKLKELADEVEQKTNYSVSHFTFENANDVLGEADIIINGTSVGMHPNIDESPLDASVINPKTYIYDTIYNPHETKLLREAKMKGCRTQNGLRMLIWQAIASFKCWTGIDLTNDDEIALELENLLLRGF
jgi:shikimate dehydrogenase